MRRLFLETDIKEKNRILEMHFSGKKEFESTELLQENIGAVLRGVGEATIRRIEKMVLDIPEIARRNIRNLTELFSNWAKLSKGERGKVVYNLFKGLSGEQKQEIARIIAKNDEIISKYFKSTEEKTREALMSSKKFTLEEIETLIVGHKLNTTNSALGQWVAPVKSGSGGLVRQNSSIVANNFKNELSTSALSTLRQGGAPRLLLPAEEKVLKNNILKITGSGQKISWSELIKSLKNELKVTGVITLFLLSAGFYEWLLKQNVTDLPPKEEIVQGGETNGKTYKLGDRVLRRGSNGDDVKDLQSKLLYYGYNLGNTGPNSNGVDGKFGPKTDEAVRSFQEDAGIKVDGLYGPESHKALMNFNVDKVSFPDDIA